VNNAIYQSVTDRIVEMLEAGVRPWAKSWDATTPAAPLEAMARPLRSNGVPYRGVNVVALWAAAQYRGLNSRYWFTYKGALEVGAHVRKGAKGEFAFFVGKTTKTVEVNGQDEERSLSFLRCYHVFNGDEIEELPDRYLITPPAPAPVDVTRQHDRNPAVDSFLNNAGVTVRHGGDKAFYMPSADVVQMPPLAAFHDAEAYYATLLHESAHWTGHASRCDRTFGKRFGDEAYAVEELTAELAAAFLCADLKVSSSPREDHASYLANWLRVLIADNKAIFHAASAADRAAAFLHAAQPQASPLELEAA
jgi:antirestriction protein ArdC